MLLVSYTLAWEILPDVNYVQLAIIVPIRQLYPLLVSLEHSLLLGLLNALFVLVDSTAPIMLRSSCCSALLEHMQMKQVKNSVSRVLKGMSAQQPLSSPLCVAVGHTAVEEYQLAPLVQVDCLQTIQVQLNVRIAQLAMHAKLLVIDQWLALLELSGMLLYVLLCSYNKYTMVYTVMYVLPIAFLISYQFYGFQCMFTLSTWSLFHC